MVLVAAGRAYLEQREAAAAQLWTGVVKSARSSGITILREVRAALAMKRRDVCEVVAHPAVVDYLINDRRRHLVELEQEFQKTIMVRADASFSQDQHVIRYY
jgi:Ribonuclease G/E